MLRVQVQKLRKAYREFQSDNVLTVFVASLEELRNAVGVEQTHEDARERVAQVNREDLRLIFFDVISAG